MNWYVLKQRLETHLNDTTKLHNTLNGFEGRRASVLVLLFKYDGEIQVLFTRRSDDLRSHKGDVCFPGGKEDETDVDVAHTALRETYEEIGLNPSHVEVLGTMMPFLSKNKLLVTPVVALIKDVNVVNLSINSDEVDDVFACPMHFFLKNEYHDFFELPENAFKLHSFTWHNNKKRCKTETNCKFYNKVFLEPKCESYFIYGLTANIIIMAAALCLNKPAEYNNTKHALEDLVDNNRHLILHRLYPKIYQSKL